MTSHVNHKPYINQPTTPNRHFQDGCWTVRISPQFISKKNIVTYYIVPTSLSYIVLTSTPPPTPREKNIVTYYIVTTSLSYIVLTSMAQAMLNIGMDYCLGRMWNSYCINKGVSLPAQNEISLKLRARIQQDYRHLYIVWEHFGDENHHSEFYGCEGDHYHILVDDRKENQTVSATATYSYLRRIQKKLLTPDQFSAMQVDKFKSYVAYLSQPPRTLKMWSQCLDNAIGRGEFNIPWIGKQRTFQPGKQRVTNIETYQTQESKTAKLTKAEQQYERLVQLVTLSNARDTRQFVDWGMA